MGMDHVIIAVIAIAVFAIPLGALAFTVFDATDIAQDFCPDYSGSILNNLYCPELDGEAREFTCNFNTNRCFWVSDPGER